jgi:putative hydrolase of the HAD superfamily
VATDRLGLTAVTFDFWATLVRDSPAGVAQQRAMRLEALARVLAQAGHQQTDGAIETAYERAGDEMTERVWSQHRDLPIREQVRLVFELLEAGLAERLRPQQFDAAVEGYVTPVLRLPPALEPGAADAVRRLAARGIRLGIVSNTGRTPGVVLRRLLARHGLLRCFQAISYSDEVGLRKPHPGIFERTLAQLSAPPAETLHVGDNPHDDVNGARGAGLRTAHYVPDGASPASEADLVITRLTELPDRLVRLAVRRPPVAAGPSV